MIDHWKNITTNISVLSQFSSYLPACEIKFTDLIRLLTMISSILYTDSLPLEF